jgi:hypothetical protein
MKPALGQELVGSWRDRNGLLDDAGLCLYHKAVDCYI